MLLSPLTCTVPALVLGLLTLRAQSEGGFSQTCHLRGANLDDKSHLGATCTNEKYEIYGYNYSVIDLDWCLANRHGSLDFGSDGGFSNSCHSCKFDSDSDKGTFSCRCSDGHGELQEESSVELDQVIFNRNGAMGCYDHVASKSKCRTCKMSG